MCQECIMLEDKARRDAAEWLAGEIEAWIDANCKGEDDGAAAA